LPEFLPVLPPSTRYAPSPRSPAVCDLSSSVQDHSLFGSRLSHPASTTNWAGLGMGVLPATRFGKWRRFPVTSETPAAQAHPRNGGHQGSVVWSPPAQPGKAGESAIQGHPLAPMFHRHRGMIRVRYRIPPGTDSTAKIHEDAPVPWAGRYDPNTLALS
jgi:hypothetical protein